MSEFAAVAREAFLIRQLETQIVALERRIQIPVELRKRSQHEAVLSKPTEVAHLCAVGQIVARGFAYGVP